MQRQTSLPGWTPRRELEEESYFNTSDDDDDEPTAPVSEETIALLSSASFGSSRRKREPTSNPAGEGDHSPKRAKLDDDADKTLTHDKIPLVDYADDDDDEDTKPVAAASDAAPQPEADPGPSADVDDGGLPAGGFIRERRGALDVGPVAEAAEVKLEVDDAPPPSTTNGADSLDHVKDDDPPFFPSLGALKRKKEQEDDDGELGLLAKRRSPFSDVASDQGKDVKPAPEVGKSLGFSFGLKKAASPPSLTSPTGATVPTSKPGGFKIAFGGLKSKFTGGGSSSSPGGGAKGDGQG